MKFVRCYDINNVYLSAGRQPFEALDRGVAVGRSHHLFGWCKQPVAHALVVALAVIVHDILRHRTPQVAFTKWHQLAQAFRLDREHEAFGDRIRRRLSFTVKSLVADMYLDDLRDKTLRGLEGRALAGFATGNVAYGYHTVLPRKVAA